MSNVKVFDLDYDRYGFSIRTALKKRTSVERLEHGLLPRLYINGKEVGGCKDTFDYWKDGTMKKWLEEAGFKTKEDKNL